MKEEIIQRRNQMSKFTSMEMAIYKAMLIVEEEGADVKLTEAVVLLERAKNKVSDYVDSKIQNKNTIEFNRVNINDTFFWFDRDFEWKEGLWYSLYAPVYAIDYFDNIGEGNIVIFDYVDELCEQTLFRYHYHSLTGSHGKSMSSPFKIIAQSNPVLINIPIVNLLPTEPK
jgi:hypothetical protein